MLCKSFYAFGAPCLALFALLCLGCLHLRVISLESFRLNIWVSAIAALFEVRFARRSCFLHRSSKISPFQVVAPAAGKETHCRRVPMTFLPVLSSLYALDQAAILSAVRAALALPLPLKFREAVCVAVAETSRPARCFSLSVSGVDDLLSTVLD